MKSVIASPAKPGVAIHARWIASTFANLSAVASTSAKAPADRLAEVEAPADTVVAALLAMTAGEYGAVRPAQRSRRSVKFAG